MGEADRKGDRDPKKRAAEIIAKLDVGGDKKLNKQEFIAGYAISFLHSSSSSVFLPPFFFIVDVKMIQSFVVC